ncbi:MAG: hypothetical protein ABSH05_06675 [Bryobacteraceae bacterium]
MPPRSLVRDECWAVENCRYRECRRPWREFRSLVSLHNHSCYSVENLASLNRVMALGFMRPLRGIVQRAFGLGAGPAPDYSQMRYNPPLRPEEVLDLELRSARRLGFDQVSLAITDHDEVRGGVELLARRPGQAGRVGLGEELSFRFQGHLFHLGLTGLPAGEIHAAHQRLQEAARANRLDDLFECLEATGCLVVLNHPLLAWDGERARDVPVLELIRRYGWAIHALEYNGMRRREENERVLDLARGVSKPVVGGGDSHLLVASSVLCGSPGAETFPEFVEEVKAGRAVPLVKSDYAAPHGWKMFLRVLAFIARYRQIAAYRGQAVAGMLQGRTVLLDPVGRAARAFLRLVSALQLAR